MITSITTIRGRRTAAQDNQTVMAARAAMVSGSGTVLPYGTLLHGRSGRPQRASRDRSRENFGYTYSGNNVTVYPGVVWLDTVECTLDAAVTIENIADQFPCVFVSVARGGGAATVGKLNMASAGKTVGPDDTHVRFTIATFDRSSGSLVLVREGATVVFNPA